MTKQIRQTKKLTALLISGILCAGLLTGCKNAGTEPTDQTETPETAAQGGAAQDEEQEISDQNDDQEIFEAFEEKLLSRMEQDGIPGASVSVTENGETIYSKGFGYADQTAEVPADENTLFYSGSVGKVYTTAAMLKLIQDHGISLDDPVAEHLPEFEMEDERYRDITLRMLLNHSAGLPSDVDALGMAAGSPIPEEATLDILEQIRSQTLRSNPGEYAVYSNIGFGIAQKVLEKLSGQTYSEYLTENFFTPLGLKNTYMVSDENEDVAAERFALPVDDAGNTLPREYAAQTMDATGAIVSSTEDICKFVDGILSPDSGILSEESIADFTKDQSLTANLPGQQELNGLGWDEISRTITQTPVYAKSGASTHFSTQTITAPKAGITISGSLTQFHNPFIYEEINNLMHDLLIERGMLTEQTDEPDYPDEVDDEEMDTNSSEIYTGGDGLHDLATIFKIDITGNTLEPYRWNGAEWDRSGEYTLREDGSYGSYDEETKTYISYDFLEIGQDTHLMKRVITPEYDTTTAIATYIPEKPADESWEKYNDALWLRTNIWPSDYQASVCFSFMQTLKELPGYVALYGGAPTMDIKDDTRLTSIPNLAGGSGYADLTFTGDRFTWIGMEFMNADEAEELPAEDSTISFAEKGAVQWYYVPEDMEIDIDVPFDQVRVLSINAEMELSYDNLYGNQVFTATAGSFVGLTSAEPGEIQMGISPVK